MKPLFLSVAILLSQFAIAQKIEKYYDYSWKETDLSAACYYALIEKQDSVWHRQDYFLHAKALQMDGFYKDKECKQAHGKFLYFHANNSLQYSGNYINGKKEGLWLRYHPDGTMADSALYSNGSVQGIRLSWHRNGFPSDSTEVKPDGSVVSVSWFDNGSISSAGYLKNGKKSGKWQFFHKNGNVASIEIYNMGVLVSKEYFNEEAKAVNDTTSRDREATYPGGFDALRKYFGRHAKFPSGWKLQNTSTVTVVVSAMIDEEGNVTEVEVVSPFHPDFDNAAIKLVQKTGKWKPAISHNRNVKYGITQPITFVQLEE